MNGHTIGANLCGGVAGAAAKGMLQLGYGRLLCFAVEKRGRVRRGACTRLHGAWRDQSRTRTSSQQAVAAVNGRWACTHTQTHTLKCDGRLAVGGCARLAREEHQALVRLRGYTTAWHTSMM